MANMKTSTNGIKFITKWEGTFLKAYRDVAGILTIGVGHTSSAGTPKVTEGMTITQAQSDRILANDLKSVESEITRLVKVPLTQNQFDALVSFHFNTGALGRSSALKSLNNKDYTKAADLLTLYNKARVGGELQTIKGLVNRRVAEKKLFLTPDLKTVDKSIVIIGTATTATVTTAATASANYMPYIIAGIFVATISIMIGFSIRDYIKHKRTLNELHPNEDKVSLVRD